MRDRKSDSHRPALERKLGRSLKSNEVADHVNMDKDDNTSANLRPESRSDHSKRHGTSAAKRTALITKALKGVQKHERMY